MKATVHLLRLGLIGCGVAARLHLAALRRVHNMSVVAASDIEPEVLHWLADRYGNPEYRRLLEDPSGEAVAVCVPPNLNPEIAIAVLDVENTC